MKKNPHWLVVLWRFSRPHTIIATTLQVFVAGTLALGFRLFASLDSFVLHLVSMIMAGLCLNIYVVGINQITDVEVDKVNKPNLPIASGALGTLTAKAVVASSGLVSLLFGLYLGSQWSFGIALILLLGTLYSCEPFHLKKHAVLSGLTIAICRGIIFNVTAFYTWLHLSPQIAGVAFEEAKILISLCSFMFAFVLVIGILKDLPDYEGDLRFGIKSYAVRLGVKPSFWAGVAILSVAYSLMIGFSFNTHSSRSALFVAMNIGSLLVLWVSASRVKNFGKLELAAFYKSVWFLFYFQLTTFSIEALT